MALVLALVVGALRSSDGGARDLSADQARVAPHVASLDHLANPHAAGLRHVEHDALLDLLPNDAVSSVAVSSGPWTDSATWFGGEVPKRDAQVLVPAGIHVTIDAPIDEDLGWLRIDGTMSIDSTVDTRLAAVTIAVSDSGSLQVGTADAPVADDVRATIEFLPRSSAMRRLDPSDLGGGLIVHGDLGLYGAPKTAHMVPASRLVAGTDRLRFAEPPAGWRVGDELVFGDVNWGSEHDEIRTIEAIEDGGRTIVVGDALDFDHRAVAGIGNVPVANLTRNLVLRSASTDALGDRGHVMVMHRHEPVTISHAAFEDLGRTDAERVHTVPTLEADGSLVPGSDANTIGRYGLHFHMRTGASVRNQPHHVVGSVITGSPKHGLVNHGGYVLAEDNIGFRNAGAHFFTENGTELGSFSGNLAIRSAGSDALIRDRDAAQDFGHQGHGFWMTSAAVELQNNWAIGHSGMGIVLFGYPLLDDGAYLYFDPANVSPGDEQPGKPVVSIADVSFRYEDNTVVSSLAGLEIWVHKLESVSGATSVVDGLRVADVAYQGMNVFYARDIEIRDLVLEQGTEHPTGIGIGTNTMAENVVVDDATIRGFAIGYVTPTRGHNVVADAAFDNVVDLQIAPPTKQGRHLEFDHVSLGADSKTSVEMLDLRVPINGDLSQLLGDDRVLWNDPQGTHRLFFPSQHESAVPFGPEASPLFGGLTSAEMHRRFGLSIGGTVAPATATQFPRSNALIGPDTVELPSTVAPLYAIDPAELTDAQEYTQKFRLQYPGAWENFRLADEVGLAADGGWAVDAEGSAVFADDEPPLFILRPSLSDLRIHPDDVRFGFRVDGQVYDRVGAFVSVRAFTQDFHALEVVDGTVEVSFTIHDMAGNALPVTLELEVTDDARRRLGNLSFFNELETGLSEIDDMNAEALAHFGPEYVLTSAQG